MEIMIKAITYGIIMVVVRAALNYGINHQKRSGLSKVKFELYKKGFANVFFTAGIVLTALLAIIFTLPSNLDGAAERIAHMVCIIFTLLMFLVSFGCNRWHFLLTDQEILCCTSFGKEKKIPISQISGFKVGENQELILYQNEKKAFVIADPGHAYSAMAVFKVIGVEQMDADCSQFVVCATRTYKLVLTCMTLMMGLFFGTLGILGDDWTYPGIGLGLTALCAATFVITTSDRVEVSGDRVHRTKLLGKTVDFSLDAVEKIGLSSENGTQFYHFYVNGKAVLKVDMTYKNAYKLRIVVDEKKIKKA